MFVGWKAAGQRTVSRAETLGLGGLFLHTPTPLPLGAVVELLFDLKTGEIRARAIVRHSAPGKGMGVQFVQMQPADRARLNQFLEKYLAADMISAAGSAKPIPPQTPAGGSGAAAPKTPETVEFEREMVERLELARRGTYYQLLGLSPESSAKQIKQSFHLLARKFHPDYHMEKKEWLGPLKELMANATTAYKVLSDEHKRAAYDTQLAKSGAYQLRRTKTTSQDNLQECFQRATEYLRAKNFVGSVVWLRKCVEIAPEEAKYRALLARSLATIPQYRQEAIDEFQRAVELDPWNAVVLCELAELYEEMQMPSRARPLYAKILATDPRHSKARQRLTELEARQNA